MLSAIVYIVIYSIEQAVFDINTTYSYK